MICTETIKNSMLNTLKITYNITTYSDEINKQIPKVKYNWGITEGL